MKLLLSLLPVALAFLAIRGTRKAVYGFFIAAAGTATILLCMQGHIEGVGHILEKKFDASVLKMVLMVGGMTMISVGPARHVARDLILRVPNAILRLLAGITLAGVGGFGNSVSAADLLAHVFPPSPRRTRAELAPLVAACTLGCILVPFSPWWIFFNSTSELLIGKDGIYPWPVMIGPVVFALAVVIGLVGERLQEDRQTAKNNPRSLLRLRPAPMAWTQVVPWLLFMAPLIGLPAWAPFIHGDVKDFLLWGILAGTAASLWFCLMMDIGGDRQILWEGAHGAEPQGRAAFRELRTGWRASYARGRAGELLLPDTVESPSDAVFLIPARGNSPSKFLRKERMTLTRLRASLLVHLGAWQDGLRNGAMTGAILIAVGIFREYNDAFVSVLTGTPAATEATQPKANLPLALLGFAVVVGAALGIGTVLGTAFGTFALVFTLLLPLLKSLPPTVSAILVGLLVSLSAAVNSSSPQADNVAAVAHSVGTSVEEISGAAKPVVLRACMASSVACLLILFWVGR